MWMHLIFLEGWLHRTTLSSSGQDAVKMDVQPKCLAVGPGGYTVVLCIGQVSINF